MIELAIYARFERLENFISLKRGKSFARSKGVIDVLFPKGMRMPPSEAELSDLESELEIALPDEYKRFLEMYGFATWYGGSIFGVPPVESADVRSFNYSVLDNTRHAKTTQLEIDFLEGVANRAIIGNDQAGGYYTIQSVNPPLTGEIEHYVHHNKWQVRRKWPSFVAFLESCVNEDL